MSDPTRVIYVSPDGSDTNPGTLAKPWRTFAKVNASLQPGDTAIFRGGDYYVHKNEYVEFTLNSDNPAKPITLKNYPGEEPILHGGLTTTWTQHQSDGVTYYSATIPATTRSDIWWQTVIRRNGWCATPIYRTLHVTLGEGASPTLCSSSGPNNLAIAGIYEGVIAPTWDNKESRFIRRYNITTNIGAWFEQDTDSGKCRLRVIGTDGNPRIDGWWERTSIGDDPPEGEYTPVGVFTGVVTVSNVESVDGLPSDFLSPPSNESQGAAGYFWSDDNRLLFDLSYVDKKTWTMYWRPADIAPSIDHDNNLLISSRATIHASDKNNIILDGLTIKHGLMGIRVVYSENWTIRNTRVISAGWYSAVKIGVADDITIEDCLVDRGNGWLRREAGGGYGDLYWQGGHNHGIYIDSVGNNINQRRNVVTRIIGGLGVAFPSQTGETVFDNNVIIGCQRPISYSATTGTISASIRANIAIACPTYRFAGPDTEPLRNIPIVYAMHISPYWNDAEQYGTNLSIEDNYLETTGAANPLYLVSTSKTRQYESLIIKNNVLRCINNAWLIQWGLYLAANPNVTFERTVWMPEAAIAWRIWDHDKQPAADWNGYFTYNDFQTAWQALGFGTDDIIRTSAVTFDSVAFGRFLDTEPTTEEIRIYAQNYVNSIRSFYVSTDGNDASPGTLEAPWRTFKKANDEARPGDTIYFRGGEYLINDKQYSYTNCFGTANKPIIFTNYPGERPVVIGGIQKEWEIDIGTGFLKTTTGITADGRTHLWHYSGVHPCFVIRKDGWTATYVHRTLAVTIDANVPSSQWALDATSDVSIDGIYEARGWINDGSIFQRRQNESANPSYKFERNSEKTEWRLYRYSAGNWNTASYWVIAGVAEDPPTGTYTAFGDYDGEITVSNVETVDSLPGDLLNPPSNLSQKPNGFASSQFWSDDETKLLFDVSYLDDKTKTLWFRPCDIAPVLDQPDSDLYIVVFACIANPHAQYQTFRGFDFKYGLYGSQGSTTVGCTFDDIRVTSIARSGFLHSAATNLTIENCYVDKLCGRLRREAGGANTRLKYGSDLYYPAGGHAVYCAQNGDGTTIRNNFFGRTPGRQSFSVRASINVEISNNVVMGGDRGLYIPVVSGIIKDNILIAHKNYRYGYTEEPRANDYKLHAIDMLNSHDLVIENNFLELLYADDDTLTPYQSAVYASVGAFNVSFVGNVVRTFDDVPLLRAFSDNFLTAKQTTWMPETIHFWVLDNDVYDNYDDFQTAWQGAGFGDGDRLKTSSAMFDSEAFNIFLDGNPTTEEAKQYLRNYVTEVLFPKPPIRVNAFILCKLGGLD